MKIWRLSAFPKTAQGGNKAGVVLDADNLSETEMQEIAKVVGYSETAFVLPSDQADVRVRFFTPVAEVDLCGHATIATFNLLRDQGHIQPAFYTQETKAGILKLDVQPEIVYMEQPAPQFFEIVNMAEIESCFKQENVIDHSLSIQVVSTGIKEIFVPIKSVEILHTLSPVFTEIIRVSKQHGAIGIHAFAIDDEVDAYGRNFAPVVGIDEESATGTSNGALSCYLYRYVTKSTSYTLRQGYSMNQPSEIRSKLDISEGSITSVWVGGTATFVREGMIQ